MSFFSPMQHGKLVRTINPSNAEAISSNAQGCKIFWKPSNPCLVGTHLKALAENSQMSAHLTGFQVFFWVFGILFVHVLAKLATTSIRVKRRFCIGLKSRTEYGSTSYSQLLVWGCSSWYLERVQTINKQGRWVVWNGQPCYPHMVWQQ